MTSGVPSGLSSQPQLNGLATRFLSQLQALQSTEAQLSSVFGAMVAAGSASSAAASASSSAGASYAAGSTGSPTGLSSETLGALLAATSAETRAASALSLGFGTNQASALPSAPAASNTAGTARLLGAGANDITSDKPDMAEFMAATGVDASTASDVLYGSIGSNQDLRDWTAIMNSATPLADARASTAALYNSNLSFESGDAMRPKNVVASTQNVAVMATSVAAPSDPTKMVERYDVALTDGHGNILRVETDPSTLAADAETFGIDAQQLSDLAAKADASGVRWRTGTWSAGLTV